MANKKKAKAVEPDGVLAGIVSALNDLESWEFKEVIKSAFKLRRATKAIAKAEARRAKMAKINKERKSAVKGLKYEANKKA